MCLISAQRGKAWNKRSAIAMPKSRAQLQIPAVATAGHSARPVQQVQRLNAHRDAMLGVTWLRAPVPLLSLLDLRMSGSIPWLECSSQSFPEVVLLFFVPPLIVQHVVGSRAP